MAKIRKTRSGKFVAVSDEDNNPNDADDRKSGPSLERVAKSFGIKAAKPNKDNIRTQVIKDRLKAKQKPK